MAGLYNEVNTNFKVGRKIKVFKHFSDVNAKGNRWHKIVTSDYHKDETGSYVVDRYYDIFFFSSRDFKDGDQVVVEKINNVNIVSGYLDNRMIWKVSLNVDIKDAELNGNIYANNGYDVTQPPKDLGIEVNEDDLPF